MKKKPIEEGIERLLSKPGRPAFGPSLLNQKIGTTSSDRLKLLSLDIAHFFGVERQDAAHFLFLIWMDCFGASSGFDLAKGLMQFRRDVNAAIKPKKPRGRPPSGVVAFALQRRENEDPPTYLQISKEWHEKQGKQAEWRAMGSAKRKKYAEGLMSNCWKKKPRKG